MTLSNLEYASLAELTGRSIVTATALLVMPSHTKRHSPVRAGTETWTSDTFLRHSGQPARDLGGEVGRDLKGEDLLQLFARASRRKVTDDDLRRTLGRFKAMC